MKHKTRNMKTKVSSLREVSRPFRQSFSEARRETSYKFQDSRHTMAIKDMAETAKKEVAELTGFKSPALVGARKEGDNWIFSIELVEKTSIPDGMDILGLYEVKADSSGNLTEYARKSNRRRADVIEENLVAE